MAAALQYLESERNARPELADWYTSLADLYRRKLWHQLALKLDQFVALAVVQAGDALVQLYHNFIADFDTNINLLKRAHIAVTVSRQYVDKEAAIEYLEDLLYKFQATKKPGFQESFLYVMMRVAVLFLEVGKQEDCKRLLEEGEVTLYDMTDADPSVHASYYWAASQYHKIRYEYADFYKNTLLYLAYSSIESLSQPFKMDLAFDLSVAALLGENMYNFGELLGHPIINSLVGTEAEWIYYMLQAFNTGNMSRYHELCHVHNAALRAQPVLVANEKMLLEKMIVLSLMEIISRRSSEDRTIPLSRIAYETKLSISGVEHLLMKCLSVHLMEGLIDQVEETVHVSWVQPRVLRVPQLKSLRDRLDSWMDKVDKTLSVVEEAGDTDLIIL